jgi:acetyl-CoA carboxylase biotin carboxylase subunit
MAAAACLAARAVQYVGAGTVEFLLANDGSFYFLEMNTRLQVEHPVTEMITGIDLVQAQFRVASGEPLWLSQDEVTMRGHSIECRIYAEDVCQNFRPAPGRIFHYLEPSGPFVRVDSGVSTDSDVPIFYDPMIAKLIVWGADRAEAIRRAKRALSEFEIVGIPTSIPLFHAILTDENFMKGQVNTAFLSEKWLEETVGSGPKNLVVGLTVAAILKQQSAERQSVQTTGQRPSSAWKRSTGWTPYGGR